MVMALTEQGMTMRQEQAATTKRKLLISAQKLFAEMGYNGTPVRSINRSIGMADGLLYHYFPGGKKEILRVMVHENARQLIDDLVSRNSGLEDLPIEKMLEHLFQNIADVFEEYQEILKILVRERELIEIVELRQFIAMAHKEQCRLPGILEARAKQGEICEMDYQSAAEVLMAVMMNHLLSRLTGIGSGLLSDPARREALIQYQVSLWKTP